MKFILQMHFLRNVRVLKEHHSIFRREQKYIFLFVKYTKSEKG